MHSKNQQFDNWTSRQLSIEIASSPRHGLKGLLALLVVLLFSASTASAQKGVLPLGSALPAMAKQVKAADGSSAAFGELKGSNATVVVFWSNKCPWCSKVENRVAKLVSSVNANEVSVILVNSNDASAFPGESAAEGEKVAAGLKVKYVVDADGSIMEAFGASRAPHFFVFDSDDTLVYLGSFDDSPADERNVEATYVADAITGVKAGKALSVTDTKAFGCLIKPKQ